MADKKKTLERTQDERRQYDRQHDEQVRQAQDRAEEPRPTIKAQDIMPQQSPMQRMPNGETAQKPPPPEENTEGPHLQASPSEWRPESERREPAHHTEPTRR